MTTSQPPTFLSGLTAGDRKIVLQSAERKKFRAHQVIINAGAPAARLFLLVRGGVKYYRVTSKGDEVLLWWLAPGDVFGLSAILRAQVRYIGTAEAIDDCELLIWPRKKIRSLASAHKVLAENALQIAFHFLDAYADRLVGLTTATAEQRLSHTLFKLCKRIGSVHSGGVELAITNEDLGGLANVSPFTASRLLKRWERKGVLKKRRGKIQIANPEGLLSD
jgi:CRP-like cAMP-binding protein